MAEEKRKALKLEGCVVRRVSVVPCEVGFELRVSFVGLVGVDVVAEEAGWLGLLRRQEVGVDVVVVSTQGELPLVDEPGFEKARAFAERYRAHVVADGEEATVEAMP